MKTAVTAARGREIEALSIQLLLEGIFRRFGYDLRGYDASFVRRRIAAGEKPDAIRAWLIQRYGTWISYKPTDEPAAWPLWLAPIALLLVGAWLIRRRITMRRS